MLIKKCGPDLDIKTNRATTPLIEANRRGHFEIVHIRDDEGRTPLRYAGDNFWRPKTRGVMNLLWSYYGLLLWCPVAYQNCGDPVEGHDANHLVLTTWTGPGRLM